MKINNSSTAGQESNLRSSEYATGELTTWPCLLNAIFSMPECSWALELVHKSLGNSDIYQKFISIIMTAGSRYIFPVASHHLKHLMYSIPLPLASDLCYQIRRLTLILCTIIFVRSWDISVAVVTACRMVKAQSLSGARGYYLIHSIQTNSWAHLASYAMGIMGSFPGGKPSGAWSWPLTSI
jgi:hypothetical protein